MEILIRDMQPEDYDQKGYVHWKSWQDTYSGLMPERFIANQTLEKCQQIAKRFPQNTLVAELNGTIIGYSCYNQDTNNAGEVIALYLLQQYHGLGIGRKMMDAALDKLADCCTITLWVLKGNDQAIGFYEHYGFGFDGTEKTAPVGTELRMIYRRP